MEAKQRNQPEADCWTFFDRIYCITLASRPDRTIEAKRQFAAVGLEDRVHFHVAEKDQEHPPRGIYHSHMHCLHQGLAAGAHRILVFEDDILFRGFNPMVLREACDSLNKLPRWDAFFLGCLLDRSTPTGCRRLTQIQYRCLTHGYCLSASFAETIVRAPWQNIPFDDFLRNRHGLYFALSPMCASQGKSISDNRTIIIERLRNLCGGLAFIQRCNEIFYKNKRTIILLHMLIAVLFLTLFRLKP